MFGGTKKKAEAGVNSEIETVIGKNTAIKGEISGSGNVRVDGKIEGGMDIQGDAVIGSTGEVIGNIKAQNLLIAGTVKGNVDTSGSLNIFASGELLGDAKTVAFSMEEGGIFRGRSEMASKKKETAGVVEMKPSKQA